MFIPSAGKAVRDEVEPRMRCQAAQIQALETASDTDLDKAEEECKYQWTKQP